MAEKKESVFETLSKIDISDHVEAIEMKNGFKPKYISWSWAWNYIKSKYPDTPTPKFEKFPEMVLKTRNQEFKTKYGPKYKKVVDDWKMTGRAVPYLTTPTGTMVTCTVEVNNEDYTESLYVMDNKNNTVIDPDQSQINKTQKRCLVKALAMAGLGLNLYAGEDLPMGDISEQDKKKAEKKQEQAKQQAEIKKVLDEYRKLLPKVAESYNTTTNEIEKQVKETATKEIKNFDKLPALNRGARMNNILENMLKQAGATEQENLLEEA